MDIVVKNISINHRNSEETYCYSADVYVGGKKAFSARNHGHGGCDMIHAYPGYAGPSVDEVDAWLKANRPVDNTYGMAIEHSLEIEIGEQLSKHVRAKEEASTRRKFAKMLADKICYLKDGAVYTIKAAPTPAHLASFRQRSPELEVLNDASDEAKERGLKAYCPDLFV